MNNFRLSRGLCAVATSVLRGSHPQLNALFTSAGAPGNPTDEPHTSKWKNWLFRAGQDPETDSLSVLGNLLEEFMDVPPNDYEPEVHRQWEIDRQRVVDALEKDGLRYYQGGRVLPNGAVPDEITARATAPSKSGPVMPRAIDDVLTRLVRGLPRAMYPLIRRRKGATVLNFRSEYDLQDLLHALMRPWVSDIRPEEFTPSYAGSSARMDFLLPAHSLVIELKLVRDHAHAKQVGKELTVDIAHYRAHPGCNTLWCVVYDPDKLLPNVQGLVDDLSGAVQSPQGSVTVKIEVIS